MERESALQELHELAEFSCLNYFMKSAMPCVIDHADRKLMAVFQELHEKEAHYLGRVYAIMAESGVYPSAQGFDLRTSFLNFLRPVALVQHFESLGTAEVDALSSLRRKVDESEATGSRIARLVDDFIALRREGMRRVHVIAEEVAVRGASAVMGATEAGRPPGNTT